MNLVLGIDLGTSFTKLGLFGRRGILCGLGRTETPAEKDGPRCQMPVEQFLATLRTGLADALSQAGAKASEIHAISYASQANSFLLLDADGSPLTPIILWPDMRAGQVDQAVENLGKRDDFLQITGFGMQPTAEFAISKIRWFQKNAPEIWHRVGHVMTISDYLLFCLTGRTVGDAGTASMLGILDQRSLNWWPAALECLNIRPELLSHPLRPGTPAGEVSTQAANLLGLPAGIPVVTGGMDHHMAAIGAGIGVLGELSESTGTVLACVRYSDGYSPMINSTCGPGLVDDQHYLLNWDDNGAAVLAWYRREHTPNLDFPELIRLAEHLPAGAMVPKAQRRADTFGGLAGFETGNLSHGHYVRAILNSTAESLAGLVRLNFPNRPPERVIATGGGARSDLWLQTYACRLGVEIVATESQEPASLGAAMLAAKAAGWYKDVPQAAADWVKIRKIFLPHTARAGDKK